jgi:hypothetical protein
MLKFKILLFVVLSFAFTNLNAQSPKLRYRNGVFYCIKNNDTIEITRNQFEIYLSTNKDAYSKYSPVLAESFFSFLFGYTGGTFIGYNLTNLLLNKTDKLNGTVIGVSLVTVGFLIESDSKRRTKKAIKMYNQALNFTK